MEEEPVKEGVTARAEPELGQLVLVRLQNVDQARVGISACRLLEDRHHHIRLVRQKGWDEGHVGIELAWPPVRCSCIDEGSFCFSSLIPCPN